MAVSRYYGTIQEIFQYLGVRLYFALSGREPLPMIEFYGQVVLRQCINSFTAS